MLVLSHWTTAVENETLRVNKPDAFTSFLLGQAIQGKEAHELHAGTKHVNEVAQCKAKYGAYNVPTRE